MTTELPKPVVASEAARSRNLFGTLTRSPDHPFEGTDAEVSDLLARIKSFCPTITKLIFQAETHDGDGDNAAANKRAKTKSSSSNAGNLHYHFLICTKESMPKTKLLAIRAQLDVINPHRNDLQFVKSIASVESYLFKDYKKHLPITEGYSDEQLENLERLADTRDKKTETMTANPNKYETRLLDELVEYFKTNEYAINRYTRCIHRRNGLDRKAVRETDFFYDLHQHTSIPSDYGSRGVKLISDHINDPTLFTLPIFTPDRDWISFNNAFYCFTEGKKYELTDPHVAHVTPIRHFDIDWPPPAPTAYFYLIQNHKWPLEAFRSHYGAMFKPKLARDPCMYLWGPPLTGKSMFYIPLIEVLGDMVGNFTKDGSFSLADLPDKLVAVLDEVDIWSDRHLTLDLVKKLLEGTEFTVARKHAKAGTVSSIHAFIATNTEPPAPLKPGGVQRDYHIEAVLSRIHPYETRDIDCRDENIARCVAKEHAPGWAVYCTQSEPYIASPSPTTPPSSH